jgi:outer membrane protein assembly factor BamB
VKKRYIVLIVIGSFLVLLFGAATYVYFWGTRFAGDLTEMGEKIPQPAGTLTPLRATPEDIATAWASWQGPSGDDRSPIKGIRKDWSKGLKKLWEVKYLCHGPKSLTWSCPAILGNRLVIPGRDEDSDYLFCLDPETGRLLWKQKFLAPADNNYGQGNRATPAIDGERVYTYSRTGVVRCHALYDGRLEWEFDTASLACTNAEWGSAGSPFIYRDKVIVHAGGAALAVALDKKTGALAWRGAPGAGGYSTPVLSSTTGADQLILFYEKGVRALDPQTGLTAWDLPRWPDVTTLNITTPVLHQDLVFVSGYFNVGALLLRVEKDGPRVCWQNKSIEAYQTNPVILDGYLYSYSGYAGQNAKSFVCLDLANGRKMWETNRIGNGTTIVADGHLVCQDLKGNLFLVKPNPKQFELVTEFRGALPGVDKNVWTKPVIAGDNIYLRYCHRLLCYRLK